MGTAPIYQTKMPWIFNVIPIIKIYYGFWGIYPFLTNIGEFNWSFVKGAFLTYLFFSGGFSLLENFNAEYTIYPQKLSIKKGLATTYYFEIDIDKIIGIHIEKSGFGEWFNYGDMVITTAGDSITYTVANPNEFKKQINLIKEK